MPQDGTVVLVDALSGRFALRVQDGSHVLAEQLDVRPLEVGHRLVGQMETVGIETLADPESAASHTAFILAYGLSFESVQQELQE